MIIVLFSSLFRVLRLKRRFLDLQTDQQGTVATQTSTAGMADSPENKPVQNQSPLSSRRNRKAAWLVKDEHETGLPQEQEEEPAVVTWSLSLVLKEC